ncbi:7 transmembrane receptor (rhodopsin family) domain-containing protein [Ditylenchus destructor]|uniref:7 transmembrane receptor (Rhodopsin family) domain-containing protein n=1 Tax=Ditylenchus destructor TaxID=166010 RepID=A0AAD4MZC4_9BILA|nr:7 transmembrane receptor (rhodopsin family) domain-containing protein [Ditylenchus destructor]
MEADALESLFLNSTVTNLTMFSIQSPTVGTVVEDNDPEIEHGMMKVPLIKAVFLFAYILVFFSCLIGNSMIITVIIVNRSMRTITNFFLANLAVADLLVGIFCVCQNGAHFVIFEHGTWPFGKTLCHMYVYILHMIPNSSAGILVLLSIERFIAVIRPMLVHHLMTKSVLVLCSVLVWIFSASMNLPYLFAVQYLELKDPETSESFGICTRRFSMWNGIHILQLVSTVNLIFWYVIPLSILMVIYITIGFVLMRTTEDDSVARSANHSRPIMVGNNRRMSEAPKIEVVDSRRRVIRLCVVIVLAFALLSAPRYIYLTWSVWRDTNSPRCLNCLSAMIQPTTFLLMFINSGINPILYAFLSQRFRHAIAETFTFSKTKKTRQAKLMLELYQRRMSTGDHLTGHSNSDVGGRQRENSVVESLINF